MGDVPSVKWFLVIFGMAYLVASLRMWIGRSSQPLSATDVLIVGLIFWAMAGVLYLAEHVYWR